LVVVAKTIRAVVTRQVSASRARSTPKTFGYAKWKTTLTLDWGTLMAETDYDELPDEYTWQDDLEYEARKDVLPSRPSQVIDDYYADRQARREGIEPK
jgi:hypothetical protein